jgi:hypothetical protein
MDLQELKIDPAVLSRLISYDEKTGGLVWLARPREFSKSDAENKRWNARYAGKPALTFLTPKGYRFGTVLGVYILAHRVVWALAHGKWPDGQIDHQNGLPSDNRLENLRVVSASGNARNRPLRSDNTSGVCGVSRRRTKWVAAIKADRLVHLGTFATKEEAISARRAAEVTYGYHENHGRLN